MRNLFVITGAGQGIGYAVAEALTARGDSVFAIGRDPAKLERARARLMFDFASADLATSAGADAAATGVRRWLAGRPLAGLVNNAGIFERKSFLNEDDAGWERYFTHNFMSAVRLTRALHADLAAAAGAVVNVSSTLGLRPVPDTLAYSALKAAMINWTQGLAREWAPEKIRVNAVCPGIVATPIRPDLSDEGARAAAAKLHPLGRLGAPEEVAGAIVHLLDARWSTGTVMTIDGGINL